MNSLEPPDSQYLEAAQGWLDLGNPVEANEELEKISAQNRAHPNVLQVRWRIEAKAGKWEACLEIATALTQVTPERRFGWLHLAMSLRKLNRTAEAKRVLISVLDKFDANTTFPYYLACYCARLGETNEAKGWFTLALANATTDQERERIVLRARDEPDLESIKPSLTEL
jgi:predicted Zn-dependent protease